MFRLRENGTNVKTEVIAGLTTFMTMAYILVVNPLILSETGMDKGAVFTATAVSSFVAILVMAFYANYPFALAPGMGLNAFFAFTVVIGMEYSFQFALTAVLLEGIIFLILTFLNVREAILNCIPINIKHAVSVGIGLFIAFIGLVNAGLVVNNDATLVGLGDITSPATLLALIGLIITGILLAKKVKGALLIGIIITTIIGIPLGVTPMPNGFISPPPSLKPIAFKFVGFDQIFSINMLIVLFTFLFVDMFDTIGTLIGVASKADMLDKDGNLPKAKEALFADALGTTVGACLGTSTVTTYVESASGVAEGGRTGLTSLITGLLFLLALFFAPIFTIVPSAATAPALILVGLFMMSPILKINLEDFTEAIPAFLTIIMMPLTYSIAEGLVFGVLSYVLLKLLTGRGKEPSPLMYGLAVLFVIKLLV
ncbi:NCS2 family permease [Thermohalobacter berrensis]|uniref:Guanine permease n=1 Tax=Thermohalobacter berrensis TaxID=99594 RepID=A0A419T2N8_9FIRM|nr:NCS2 family permease [Thermohalobacter berrensis]RKD31678.1 guanine permease [Thermohalobacter berrensis]